MSPEKEIAQLRDQIHHHDHLYFVANEPAISDREYDKLFARLKQLEADHPDLITADSPTQRVSEKPMEGFRHVNHSLPMMSIDNTYNEAQLREWDARVARGLEGAKYEYIVDPKIDGVSASLRYENGSLTVAATRGDGRVGDDVTANIRTIRAVPLRLHGRVWPAVLEVRGEVYWPRRFFDEFNAAREKAGEEPFANPRNATAGTLKSLDARAIANRRLSFMSHGFGQIEGTKFGKSSELFAALKMWGIPVSSYHKLFRDIDEVIEFIRTWDQMRHTLEYETDGIVIKVDRLSQRDILGATSRFPRWCIAYKYAAERAQSVVKEVDFQIGKLGTITPRAVMEPMQLSGTTVRHASLHNFDQVRRLDVRIGDTVVVEKAGEIIPQVIEVVKEKRPRHTEPIVPPKKCPVCKGEVEKDEGGVYIRCINPSCEAQLKERLRFFCGRDQMDIEGGGEALINQLVDAGLLKQFADLYALKDKRDKLLKLERMGAKSVDNLLAGIEASKRQPLSRVLAAMNIRHVGAATAELVAEHFGEMSKIANASKEELQEIDGIGPEVAHSVHHFFTSNAGGKAWRALADAGVNMTQPKQRRSAHQPLAGKTVVVTGTLEKFSRSEIEKLIKELGGKVAGSVSKKTDFLVVGADAGSKLEKAQGLGVKTLSEEEFIALANAR